MLKPFRTGVFAATALVVGLSVGLPAAAGAAETGPIDETIYDLTNCDPYARVPAVSSGYITGSGGTTGCSSTRHHVDLKVCLELAHLPVACVDKEGMGDQSATTPRFPCVPGLYQTRTTAVINLFKAKTIHSIPPVLIVQCV